ncbi:hypothetical protein CUJ87_15040 [Paraburkholderia caledonica]|nr:hypothetical protein CUJ87_15040 [Paraburkholderia caledonica]
MVSLYGCQRSWAGRRTVRDADDCAGMGGRKKRRPGCNGPDRGWDITPRESGQTSVWSTVARRLTTLCNLVRCRCMRLH